MVACHRSRENLEKYSRASFVFFGSFPSDWRVKVKLWRSSAIGRRQPLTKTFDFHLIFTSKVEIESCAERQNSLSQWNYLRKCNSLAQRFQSQLQIEKHSSFQLLSTVSLSWQCLKEIASASKPLTPSLKLPAP